MCGKGLEVETCDIMYVYIYIQKVLQVLEFSDYYLECHTAIHQCVGKLRLTKTNRKQGWNDKGEEGRKGARKGWRGLIQRG